MGDPVDIKFDSEVRTQSRFSCAWKAAFRARRLGVRGLQYHRAKNNH